MTHVAFLGYAALRRTSAKPALRCMAHLKVSAVQIRARAMHWVVIIQRSWLKLDMMIWKPSSTRHPLLAHCVVASLVLKGSFPKEITNHWPRAPLHTNAGLSYYSFPDERDNNNVVLARAPFGAPTLLKQYSALPFSVDRSNTNLPMLCML